jgi:lipid-A-disaccharide synthase
VDLAFNMTAHAVVGLSDVFRNFKKFMRLFRELRALAIQRQPDAIICVDFSGFNRRFAHTVRNYCRKRQDWFHDWSPKLVQYVSPQVWASREARAYKMAADFDLVLSIFPFEEEWYGKRVPQLRVEYVGHPILDRYASLGWKAGPAESADGGVAPLVALLPGSRASELARHLPVLVGALAIMRASMPSLRARMVLPNDALVKDARTFKLPSNLEVQAGGLPETLSHAKVALASTGTVTMECAYFGVPTVALYKTSWTTYQVGRRIVTVKHMAMPNLLAGEEIFPEFIQDAATPENLGAAALDLLRDEARRARLKKRLAEVIASFGQPGASRRAAKAISGLLVARPAS